MRSNWIRFAGPAALSLLALFGPLLSGSPDLPAIAVSAGQLLPPGSRVQEATLEGGGFIRARRIVVEKTGLRVRTATGWRTLEATRLAGPVRTSRLWLGSDHQGRSLLARAIHGTRISLSVAAVATLLALLIGTVAGLGTALLPRRWTVSLQLGTDGLLGLPRILLLLILGLVLQSAPLAVALAIGLASWMEVGRLVEAEARSIARRPFVTASVSGGAGRARVAWFHLLPNLAPILSVAAPLVATEAILLESTLAFLGVGGTSSSSWGRIVADGQHLLPGGWWIVVFPGVLLTATALAVHGLTRVTRGAAASSAFPA